MNWSKPRMKNLYQTVLLLVLAVSASAHAEFFVHEVDRLHYEVTGHGSPIILVSGGGGMDARQWDFVAPGLAQSHRVITYEPRGVGKSDNPTVKYSDTADLNGLLDHLGLDSVILIGVSSAGGFALEFAIQYPDRVSRVVAAAPFVPGFEFSEVMMTRLNDFNRAAQQGRDVFLDKMFADPHFIPAPLDRTVRNLARKIMTDQFDKGDEFDETLTIPLQPPLIEQLAAIRVPVLMLAGELDHPEVLRRNKFLTAEIRSAEESMIPDAGHNGQLENPDAFRNAMKSFLLAAVWHPADQLVLARDDTVFTGQ
jgi:pimeloyl-ACP methyl ester carboxylesterase